MHLAISLAKKESHLAKKESFLQNIAGIKE